jgi:hypothetical protein
MAHASFSKKPGTANLMQPKFAVAAWREWGTGAAERVTPPLTKLGRIAQPVGSRNYCPVD